MQDPSLIPHFFGEPKIGTNEAVALASKTIRQLLVSADPTTNGPAIVRVATDGRRAFPLFWVSWPTTNVVGYPDYAALVEIDARKSLITYLRLRGEWFWDKRAAESLSNRVCRADPNDTLVAKRKLSNRPSVRLLPAPSPGEVLDGIRGWLWLCQHLGVEPGPQTNLAAVDWPMTICFTNPELSAVCPQCLVTFKNGATFEYFNGVTFSHFSSDSCFVGFWSRRPREEWQPFEGKVTKHWEELAKKVEAILVKNAGLDPLLIRRYEAAPTIKPPEIGSQAVRRIVIEWRHWPKRSGFIPVSDSTLGFRAELDLQSGDLKWLKFDDPSLISALGKRQGKSR